MKWDTEDSVNEALQILKDPESWRGSAEKNHEIARQHYSYKALETSLKTLLQEFGFE